MSIARLMVLALAAGLLSVAACGSSGDTQQKGTIGKTCLRAGGCDGGISTPEDSGAVAASCTADQVESCKILIPVASGGSNQNNCYVGERRCVGSSWGQCTALLDPNTNQPIQGVIDSATGNILDPTTGAVLVYADGGV